MRLFETLAQDVRYALRMLRQNPGFAAIAILSLALGIGANTAIFSLVNAILLRSLPVRAPQELVNFAINPDNPQSYFSNPDYEYIRDHNQSFAGVIAHGGGGGGTAFAAADEGVQSTAQLVSSQLVSGNFFDVTPAVGRLFNSDDNRKEGASPWVVLDYTFWQKRFGGDPRAVGKRVTLNGSPFTIIGVARSGFDGTAIGNHPDMYVPIMMYASLNRFARQWNTRHQWWLNVMARLNPGVTMAAAKPEADVLWKQMAADPEEKPEVFDKDYAKRNRGTLLEASGAGYFLRQQLEKPLVVLMIVVALVLLIACANVANLLLVRATVRQREIAIRLAIGAARGRLIAQLVIETFVIAMFGAIAGVGIAWWGVRVLLKFMPRRQRPWEFDLTPDWRVLAFCFGVCLVVGLLCGLAPAIQATRPGVNAALKNETAFGRIRFDLRRALVVLQVAASLLLLIGAGLFVRSLSNLDSLDPGFDRQGVLLVDVNPAGLGYKSQQVRDYFDRAADRLRALPNVHVVSLANITPLAGSRMRYGISVEGYTRGADEEPWTDVNEVGPGYFATMRIPLIAGRDFRDQDNPPTSPDPKPRGPKEEESPLPPPAPVAIVNEAFTKKYFPNQSALGRHFTTDDKKFDMSKAFEIVGVVKDSNYFDIRHQNIDPIKPMIYIPQWRFGAVFSTICLRVAGRPEAAAGAVRRELAKVDAAIPVLHTVTLEDQFDSNISTERTISTLCGFFASLALLLAAIGLYGVMAYTVTRRYREIGIRMALGAERGSVLWLMLRDTAWMVGVGALIGLPVAFGLTRLVASFLYGLTPQDPLSIALATLGLIIVTGIAGYIPALRATRVDPLSALRHE